MATEAERLDIRRLLLDAAAQFHESIKDTYVVVNRTGTFTLPETARSCLLSPRAVAFVKMYLSTDTGESGTNWAGETAYFDYSEYTGVFMFLNDPLVPTPAAPSAGAYVNVTYIVQNGLDDDTVDLHMDLGKLLVEKMTNRAFAFDSSTNDESLAYYAACYMAAWGLILSASGVNVLMEGINYRLGDLEVQTKTWGEGMIAEPLLRLFLTQTTMIISLLRSETIKWAKSGTRTNTQSAVHRHWNAQSGLVDS